MFYHCNRLSQNLLQTNLPECHILCWELPFLEVFQRASLDIEELGIFQLVLQVNQNQVAWLEVHKQEAVGMEEVFHKENRIRPLEACHQQKVYRLEACHRLLLEFCYRLNQKEVYQRGVGRLEACD